MTGKGHPLVLSPGLIISSICGKAEIQILFCGAKNLPFLWSVSHGFTRLFLSRGAMYSGYAWPHSDFMTS